MWVRLVRFGEAGGALREMKTIRNAFLVLNLVHRASVRLFVELGVRFS